jgi:hypothetical protein
MGLTQSKIQDLKDKKFDKLYNKHKGPWLQMVDDAYQHTKSKVLKGENPRPDDVLKTLMPQIELSDDLRDHQADNKARFRYFREYFAEYIIDKYFEQQGL